LVTWYCFVGITSWQENQSDDQRHFAASWERRLSFGSYAESNQRLRTERDCEKDADKKGGAKANSARSSKFTQWKDNKKIGK
jgi:hypothetical protein